MPEIPFRQNPGFDPGEENDISLSTGTAGRDAEYPMTNAERAARRRCLREKEARRIPPGFALPSEDAETACPERGTPGQRLISRDAANPL